MAFIFAANNKLTLQTSFMEALLKRKMIKYMGAEVRFVAGAADVWVSLGKDEYVMVLHTGTAIAYDADAKTLLVALFTSFLSDQEEEGDDFIVLEVEIKRAFTIRVTHIPDGAEVYLNKTHKVEVDGETKDVECKYGPYSYEIRGASSSTPTIFIPSGIDSMTISSETTFDLVAATLKTARKAWLAAGKPRNKTKKRMRL